MGARSRSRERVPRSSSDVAPTELDSDSEPPQPPEVLEILSSPEPQPPDDDQPIIPVAPLPSSFPYCILPFWGWTNFSNKYAACQIAYKGRDLQWDLAPPEPPSERIHAHIQNVVETTLHLRRLEGCKFKVGLTAYPETRFLKREYNFLMTWVLVYCTENSSHTSRLEKDCIKFYKDRHDSRIQNIKPGGEGAHIHPSPHFLYVVFGTESQFRRGARLPYDERW